MNQFKMFRFSPLFPRLGCYSVINSTDNKNPVFLGTKESFRSQGVWMNYIDNDEKW